jgi:hypothetical protein
MIGIVNVISKAFPFLGAFFTTAFATVFTYFATNFTRRMALALTTLAFLTALWVGFLAVISSAIIGLTYSLPPNIGQSMGLFLPTNISAIIAVFATVHLADLVFALKQRLYDRVWGGGMPR